jgi:hypothetical protein
VKPASLHDLVAIKEDFLRYSLPAAKILNIDGGPPRVPNDGSDLDGSTCDRHRSISHTIHGQNTHLSVYRSNDLNQRETN